MPFWILISLIPLGEPHAFLGKPVEDDPYHDTKLQCLQALDKEEYENPKEKYACIKIE